jgi:RNA polymerase sigma factor (TIGR02999 family)
MDRPDPLRTETIKAWLEAQERAGAQADGGTGSETGQGAAVNSLSRGQRGLPSAGSPSTQQLFQLLYGELKRGASAFMRKEHAGHTLSATALTHEAWLRLQGQHRTQWQSRSHFLGVASIMMRRILVNHALARRADKRDVPLVSLTLTEAQQVAGGDSADLVRVHEALLAFEQVDPRAAKVVELKFFGGLEVEEIAEVLGLGSATVKRDWALARSWLYRALSEG